MKPHQERVVKEKEELDSKLDLLHNFICSSVIFEDLEDEEKIRLTRQRAAMNEYSMILAERIENFK